MKSTVLLLTLLLASPIAMAQATETDNNDHEFIAFCNEQADMAGIEEASEKKQYINSCLKNYGVTPQE